MNEIKEILLNTGKPIYVAGHENADYDAIGSSLALTIFLNKLGKKAYSLVHDKDLKLLNLFDSKYVVNKITDNDYVFVAVDLNKKYRLGKYEEYFDQATMTINIDHHEDNGREADYILSLPDVSSTAQIVYELIKLFDIEIDGLIGSLIYAGMVTDTSGFLNVDGSTHFLVNDLLKLDFDSRFIYRKVSLEKTVQDIETLTKMLSEMKKDQGFHYVIVDHHLEEDIDFISIKKAMGFLKNIEGVEIVAIITILKNANYIDFRSNNEIDVDRLASELGGGGHKKASGATSYKRVEEILDTIREYIKKETN